MNKIKLIAIVGAAALLAASCSTQKAGWTNVTYHNTTAHYNVWWNGNESLKKGVDQLEKGVKDDYTRLLPVCKLGTKEQAAMANPQFDRAVEKGIKGIKKHSIMVNGVEHVAYVPQCYLLTAKASFYKHDYTSCASTCQMMSSQFSGTEAGDEAAILLARCSAQEGRYFDAESALDELVVAAGKGAFSKKQKLALYMAMAECTLPQEKYKKGVQFLKMALDEHPSQDQRARIYYILGQVYQQQDKRPTATKYYEQVLKCHPSYELEFNTRLNIISCADPHHTDRAKLERLLVKMEKDKKNEEFLDQILYAKGEMYMGMRETKKAVECFRNSVAKSKSNPAQKARSAIRLGSILYDKYQDYDRAQLYYDTAMTNIKSDYPHYDQIRSRYELLTSLTTYTRVLDRNDSLIRVADMPADKQQKLIAEKIELVKKAEKEAKERELLEQLAGDSKAAMNTLQGDWYFYNSNTVQKGKESFRQRWGMRTLEDYWFLSKKGLLGMNMLSMDVPADTTDLSDDEADAADDEENAKKEFGAAGNPNDPHDPAYYLKDLPKSQADRDSMNAATAVCLLNAGYIYYDGVNNIPKALECYQRMANDHTDNREIVQAFFMLYKIYDKQGNTPNANYYRDMVLMGFPDSDFSNLILDEDYYKEIIRRSQLIKEDYDEVYTFYRKHRYDKVLQAVASAKELYAGNPMLGKFRFWEGLAYARMDNKAQAISTLEGIVADYPATDSIVPLAQMQLEYLRGEGGRFMSGGDSEEAAQAADSTAVTKLKPAKNDTDTQALADADQKLSQEAQLFRYKESQPHYVIVLLNDRKIRATDMQVKITDFNMTYYANAGLKVSPLMFSDTTQMVTINRFKDATTAMDYYRHLQRDESPLQQYAATDYQVFVISVQNYTTFYNRKRIDAYKSFFDKNYLSK